MRRLVGARAVPVKRGRGLARGLLVAALWPAVVSADASPLACPEPGPVTSGASVREALGLTDTYQAMLWRFHGAPGEGFVFGTVHLGPPMVKRPPPSALLAIRQSDVYAGELVMNEAARQMFVARAAAPDDDSAGATFLGEALRTRYLDAVRRRGLAAERALSLRPWAASLAIGRPPLPAGASLDEQLEATARRMRREVVGLQPVEALLEALEAIPVDDQIAMLVDAICQQSRLADFSRELLEVYSSGSPEAVRAFSRAGREDDPVYARMDERLVRRRNVAFLERLLGLLDRGSVFVAVGAQHLAGDDGLLALLRARGFAVERWRP